MLSRVGFLLVYRVTFIKGGFYLLNNFESPLMVAVGIYGGKVFFYLYARIGNVSRDFGARFSNSGF